MNLIPDKKRLAKLDLTEVKLDDVILFCPECDFQIVHAAMKPVCPNCGCRLHITHAGYELFILVGQKKVKKRKREEREAAKKFFSLLPRETPRGKGWHQTMFVSTTPLNSLPPGTKLRNISKGEGKDV